MRGDTRFWPALIIPTFVAVSWLPVHGDSRDGSFVRGVEDDSPAAEAGIEEGDILRKVNGRIVHTAAEATRELQRIQVGRPTFVVVWRTGRETLVEMHRE
jgi:S1-C subfamily serine protease